MIERIINRFESVEKEYEKVIQVTDSIFQVLKNRELKELDALNRKQLLYINDLEEQIQLLKEGIHEACSSFSLEEKKISSLSPYMNVEQKEKIMSSQKEIFQYEGKLSKNLRLNQQQIEIMMAPSEAIIEVYVETMQEKDKTQSSVFVDKKF